METPAGDRRTQKVQLPPFSEAGGRAAGSAQAPFAAAQEAGIPDPLLVSGKTPVGARI